MISNKEAARLIENILKDIVPQHANAVIKYKIKENFEDLRKIDKIKKEEQ